MKDDPRAAICLSPSTGHRWVFSSAFLQTTDCGERASLSEDWSAPPAQCDPHHCFTGATVKSSPASLRACANGRRAGKHEFDSLCTELKSSTPTPPRSLEQLLWVERFRSHRGRCYKANPLSIRGRGKGGGGGWGRLLTLQSLSGSTTSRFAVRLGQPNTLAGRRTGTNSNTETVQFKQPYYRPGCDRVVPYVEGVQRHSRSSSNCANFLVSAGRSRVKSGLCVACSIAESAAACK